MVPTRFGGRPRLWSRKTAKALGLDRLAACGATCRLRRHAASRRPHLMRTSSSGWSRFAAASCFRCQRSADLSDEDGDATKKKYNHDDKQVVRDCLPKVDFDAASEIEANSNDNCTA